MNPRKKKPLGSGAASRHSQVGPGERAIGRLLSRLNNVRRQGEGYRADCPNGHSKAKGSLSIGEDADRVLMHCFACGDTARILEAIGLSLSDLYDRPLVGAESRQNRRERQRRFRMHSWSSALTVLTYEAQVVLIAAEWAARGRRFEPEDLRRLRRSICLLQQSKEVLGD